jgi:hypothetical protein
MVNRDSCVFGHRAHPGLDARRRRQASGPLADFRVRSFTHCAFIYSLADSDRRFNGFTPFRVDALPAVAR